MAVTSGHFIRKGTDQRPAATAAFAFSLRRFFVDIQGHGRAPGCPFQEGNGKTQHGKENPKFSSRLPQPQPVSKTDGDHRSIAPFKGKGGSEGAMHRAGRDPRPVPESVCATRNAIQTRLLIKLQLYFTTASQHPLDYTRTGSGRTELLRRAGKPGYYFRFRSWRPVHGSHGPVKSSTKPCLHPWNTR